MNKIKALCDKYKKDGLSHRTLGILMGYHRCTIQKINTGKYLMTASFATLLDGIERGLNSGDVKIPQ